MTTDYRALCAELLDALENAIGVIYGEDGTKHISTADAVITKADAALAQPEPEGLTDDGEIDEEAATLIPWLLEEAAHAADADQFYAAGKLTLAAQLLGERRPAIEPVPTSERPWEREVWCDAEGSCYGWDGDYWWMVGNPGWANETITHWLPHHALPVPQQEVK